MEKDDKAFKDLERYIENFLKEKAVKTAIQIIYDKGCFDNFDKTNEVIKDYLPIDVVNERRKLDLEELIDVAHWFCS